MDKGKSCAVLLADLSKAFDCIVYSFLIAKLKVNCFSYESLKVMQNYLIDRKHRTKVNYFFSDFIDVLLGVLQDSVFGPLLLNICICNIFFEEEEEGEDNIVAMLITQLLIQRVKNYYNSCRKYRNKQKGSFQLVFYELSESQF